jgi:hypothetical protein
MFCEPPKKGQQHYFNSKGPGSGSTKQTNTLQVDNLITNKCVAIFEASKRVLNTQCVKISVLANVKTF